MKIGKVAEHITDDERAKVADLPTTSNAYLEIEKVDVDPGTGEEGQLIYNTVEEKFKLWETDAWVEVLFSMEKVTP